MFIAHKSIVTGTVQALKQTECGIDTVAQDVSESADASII